MEFQFYIQDLYSNVDAGFREMYRDGLGSLFKKDIKIDVIGQSSSKALKDEKSQGLFGGQILCIQFTIIFTGIIISGDKRIRTVLSNATKKSTVLSRAIVPKYPKRDRDDGSSPERRTRVRSRSRSPATDRKADRYDKSVRNSRYSSKKGKGKGSKSNNKKSPDSTSKKSSSKTSN